MVPIFYVCIDDVKEAVEAVKPWSLMQRIMDEIFALHHDNKLCKYFPRIYYYNEFDKVRVIATKRNKFSARQEQNC
jgi:hypothetical protein